jgi:hypothetical protein
MKRASEAKAISLRQLRTWKSNCRGVSVLERTLRYPVLKAVVVCMLVATSLEAYGQSYAFNRADFGVGNNPVGGTTADFNGDRKCDMAVLNFDDASVSILLANGDGTFKTRMDVSSGPSPTFVTSADVNGDHKPDLIVTNGSANTISVLLGNGDGSFHLAGSFATGSYPLWADVADFNGDGKPDVVTANYSGNSVSILLGNGDGTFPSRNDLQMSPTPDSVVAGDFNGDGKVDVAVANATGTLVGIVTLGLGNGDGTLRIGKKAAVGPLPQSIATGDFNGDGKLDLVVANLQTGVNTVSLILGNGDGTFQPDQEFATAYGPYRLTLADFNRDGKLDVAVASPSNLGSFASILLGNGDGTLQPHVDYATGENTDWVMPINVNGDFYADLAVVYTDCVFGICSGPGTGAVSILVATGRGTFGPRQDFATDLDPAQVTLADLDGDGILDAVTANTNSSTVSVLLGKGDGTFQPHVDSPTGASPEGVAVADFNGDGVPDLAIADSSGNTVSILLGKGDGSFQGHADLPTGQFPVSIAAGDFNNDGKVDLAVGNGGPNVVSILIGNGDGGFKTFQTFAVAGPATSLALGDFNRDGKLDIVTSTSSTGASLLFGNGDGSFQPHVEVSTGGTNLAVVVADFNRDGRADIAAAAYNANGFGFITVLLGNGDGTFQPHQDSYPASWVPLSISAGDLDGDASPDIITANYGTAAVFLGKGDGTFLHSLNFATGDGSTSAAVGDLNGDGATDFVTANTSATPVNGISVYLNAPILAISPAKIEFPPQLVGTTGKGVVVSISNPSIAPLAVSSITLQGDFTETNTCGTALVSGGNCAMTVSFAASQRGVARGNAVITTNGIEGPRTVKLIGTATVVELQPSSLNFGTQPVGVKSRVRWITVRNTSASTLHISGIGVGGMNAGDFNQTNDCGRGLLAGGSCELRVTFKPSAQGLRKAFVSITDDGGASPQTPSLVGTGQ